jgi:hypothetical protein
MGPLMALHGHKTDDLQMCFLGSAAVEASQRTAATAGIQSRPVLVGSSRAARRRAVRSGTGPSERRPLYIREAGRTLKTLGGHVGSCIYAGYSLSAGTAGTRRRQHRDGCCVWPANRSTSAVLAG